jgi:hypothetical protein
MNLPLFLAKRIYSDDGDHRKVSRPAIRIATIGVAIGLAVMIITVSVVIGFKHTIQDKVIGFGSHIQVESFIASQSTTPYPVCIDDSLIQVLQKIPGVRHVGRFALTQGILKTDQDFLGVAVKGIGEDYDTHFLVSNLVEGKLPKFSSKQNSNQVVISRKMANKLHLKAGDKVRYKVAEDVLVDGNLIFAKGEPGEGTVEKVRQAKNFGRNAEVQIDFNKTKSIDGTEIETYVGEESKQEMKHMAMAAGASVAGMLLLGPIGIIGGAFVKGKNIDLPEGTELYIQTKNEESLYGVATVAE